MAIQGGKLQSCCIFTFLNTLRDHSTPFDITWLTNTEIFFKPFCTISDINHHQHHQHRLLQCQFFKTIFCQFFFDQNLLQRTNVSRISSLDVHFCWLSVVRHMKEQWGGKGEQHPPPWPPSTPSLWRRSGGRSLSTLWWWKQICR